MEITEKDIGAIVTKVVERLKGQGVVGEGVSARAAAAEGEGVHADVETALRAAKGAFEELSAGTLKKRKEIVAAWRRTVQEHAEELSRVAVEETGLGRVEDKIRKNLCVGDLTPGVEDLEPVVVTGDHGLTLTERAPYGVIGAITPCTNPSETIICNGIGMVAAGNAVVFNGHPQAKGVTALTVKLMNRAARAVGGPANLLNCVGSPTIASAGELMKHALVKLLVVTGGGGVVKAAMNSGKKVIAAGPGNPPAVVDETADIEAAGKGLVAGASLDNNIICVDEKETFVVEGVAEALKAAMVRHGAYEAKGREVEALTELVLKERKAPPHESVIDKKWVGKNASVILKAIGVEVPEATRLVICEVGRDHPLVWTEQLMPVYPVVRVKDADEGIELALEAEHGYHHTASMWSRNIEKLSKMARLCDCSIYVKNGPNYAGLGLGGEGYTSFTIASPTGDGLTGPKSFSRIRRCTLVDYFRIV